jgi:hypothetical protein
MNVVDSNGVLDGAQATTGCRHHHSRRESEVVGQSILEGTRVDHNHCGCVSNRIFLKYGASRSAAGSFGRIIAIGDHAVIVKRTTTVGNGPDSDGRP